MTAEKSEPILVLGDGGWGTALAMVLSRAGHEVTVWSCDVAYARRLSEERENTKFLPGVTISPDIRFTGEIGGLATRFETVFSVVPTQFLRATLEKLRSDIPPSCVLVSCSKGFERGTLELPSEIIRQLLPNRKVVVLSGPSHAEEVSRDLPTTVVVAAGDQQIARRVQQLVTTPHFRAYTSNDPRGVEIAGATKNVIALAAGISDGLGFGDNARAGLVCRGASEMTRLGGALDACPETFAGLSGIGDLVATCTSRHSRNHEVGYRIARGETLAEVLSSTEKVAEGVETTRSVRQLASKVGVELPITAEVYGVLFEGRSPRKAVEALMGRELKEE